MYINSFLSLFIGFRTLLFYIIYIYIFIEEEIFIIYIALKIWNIYIYICLLTIYIYIYTKWNKMDPY